MAWSPPCPILVLMNRTEILLQNLDPSRHLCIEIGALDKPTIPASERVFYVDHMDTPSLREKYKDEPFVKAHNLVEVRGIWGRNTLAEAAHGFAPVDFIIASHVVEHVPDLVSWLQELAAVLKPGGEIRLAIPDRRFSFDIVRRTTQLPEVLAAYAVRARAPLPAQVADFIVHHVDVSIAAAWAGQVEPQNLKRTSNPTVALKMARESAAGQYHDVHCWVFTPASFCELMEQLARMGLVHLSCSMFEDTRRHTLEFFAGLQPCGDPETAAESWGAIAADLRARQAEQQAREQLEAQAQLALLTAERDAARAQAAALAREVEALRMSTSWRITAPLRALRAGSTPRRDSR